MAIYVIFCVAIALASCVANEEKLLLKHLLGDDKELNKFVRPVARYENAILVDLGLTINNIISFDEATGDLKLSIWIQTGWNAYNMKWNPNDYGGVQSIRLSPDLIYTPDITLYNGVNEPQDNKPTMVMIQHDGRCLYVPPSVANIRCLQAVKSDQWTCILKFGSWTYDGGKVDLEEPSYFDDMRAYKDWEIRNSSYERHAVKYACCPEEYIDITYTFNLVRYNR